ncbi:DUF488 domain-containing protein [Alloprevotella tannerae]|jgi:transcriptional regulator, MarR family|uniref:DUF488 domain-containing protein n=1 Tax=Alloprevotella tannerae TaxID=76122 RepID=UPI0025DDFD71|nr:DUF488 family protein [Alloprevotella tannerae]
MIEVVIKRVYDGVSDSDGMRILVDKLWPRGVKKENLPYDIWAKNVTPTPDLRKMFHEDPDKNWTDFAAAYRKELESSDDLKELVQQIKEENPPRVTLLYAFKNKIRNHAVVLQEELQKHL